MADWPDNAQKIGNDCYYKVATDADEILVGNSENDIKRGVDKNSQTHAHYIKRNYGNTNGEWYVTNREGRTHKEIVAIYGKKGYGDSQYGTEGQSVSEEINSWLDGLLDQWR